MDLLNMIPAPIWGLIALAFAFWYMFMRGKKKRGKRRTLSQLKRKDEATKRRLNIARNEDRLEEMEEKAREKARKKKGDPFKW